MTNQEHIGVLLQQYRPRFGDPNDIRIKKLIARMEEAKKRAEHPDEVRKAIAAGAKKKIKSAEELENYEYQVIFALEQSVEGRKQLEVKL